MASHSELSLDYKPNIAYPSMIPNTNGDHSDQTNKLQEFLARLEEERLKIEAFKRELPLCMQLLNNAVDAYKQQLELYRSSQGPKPVLEEFIPIKQIGVEGNDKENDNPKSEKSSWMESAQLWSPSSNDSTKPQIQMKEPSENKTLDMIPKLSLESKQRNGGGAFLPFSKDKSKNDSTSTISPELALVTVEKEREDQKKHSDQMENTNICLKKENGDQIQGKNMAEGQLGTTQSHRKARRCWSPDLHRRFVNALQILGGAQVATPKQIRELMKVDGLTNDEVKSHLQKYRLHTRRPIPAPQQATSAPPQLVVLGGIWVPHEYAASAGGSAIYGAHPGVPSHYCTAGPVGAQEFYASQAMMAPHLQHGQIRHGMNGSFKNRNESCESEERSRENQSESIEEEGEDKEEEEEDDVAQVPGVDGMLQNGTSGTEVALKF